MPTTFFKKFAYEIERIVLFLVKIAFPNANTKSLLESSSISTHSTVEVNRAVMHGFDVERRARSPRYRNFAERKTTSADF